MDIDIQPAAPTIFTNSPASPDTPVTLVAHVSVSAAKQVISGFDSAKISGAKPTISANSISDFRSLSSLLIKCNFPFHTYALGEERKIRLGASRSGTAVYYKRKLYCCPINIPTLINLEASAWKLAMTGYGTLIIASVYMPPKKRLVMSDIETLLALGDAVILFGDLNSKNTDWSTTNTSKRTFPTLAEDHELASYLNTSPN
ncbi:RNA-directed DNA polymerase from mobile element jockey [Eumeta japonica]|uniref:RNA-directed DNA polymerase from mobile element jockey n=1 Tax=Eumeta variegata TaxID=151549 RepID=A0A4C1TPE4_EUMVA|nr:RNA-directed DNA polymerase from mobile element jockey [Eumeta japonica]